jgi:hypothetical protein
VRPALKLFLNNCRVHNRRTAGSGVFNKTIQGQLGVMKEPKHPQISGRLFDFFKSNTLTKEYKNRRFWLFEKYPRAAGFDERNRQRPSSFFLKTITYLTSSKNTF